jgi:hypothetical protein
VACKEIRERIYANYILGWSEKIFEADITEGSDVAGGDDGSGVGHGMVRATY